MAIETHKLKDFPEVENIYNYLYDKFLHIIPHNRFFIAGGFARFCIEGQLALSNNTSKNLPSDIDIYLCNKHDLNNTLKAVYDRTKLAIEKGEWHHSSAYHNNNGHNLPQASRGIKFIYNSPQTLTLNYTPIEIEALEVTGSSKYNRFALVEKKRLMPIQIIKFISGTPYEVLSDFDFTCITIAIDKDNIYMNNDTIDHIKERGLYYNKIPDGYSHNLKALFIKRLMKYTNAYGYIIKDSKIIKNVISNEFALPNKYDDLFQYTIESLTAFELATFQYIFRNIDDKIKLVLYMSKLNEDERDRIIYHAVEDIIYKKQNNNYFQNIPF